MFDPYHKWLGIPPGQRPPTHYQLLGITPGERDPEVIEEAAIRQTAHVRTYQIGPHAAECTRLLNEIALARTTLLTPAKRQRYDAQFARQAAAQRGPSPQFTAAALPPVAPGADAFAFTEGPAVVPLKGGLRLPPGRSGAGWAKTTRPGPGDGAQAARGQAQRALGPRSAATQGVGQPAPRREPQATPG